MRAFIAVDLPNEIKEELANVQKQINSKEDKLTFVSPENMHLTIKFLGEITAQQAKKLKEILSNLKIQKFTGKLSTLGMFSFRVLWAGLEPMGEFLKIHDLIDKELVKLGFETDKKWESHVTLARVKRIKNKTKFFEALNKITVKPLEFGVGKIVFKKSTLTSSGPIYEDI